MSAQPNITDYFNSRKRAGSSNVKSRTKVLILEAEKCLKITAQDTIDSRARVVYQESKYSRLEKTELLAKDSSAKKTPKSVNKSVKSVKKQTLLTDFTRKASTNIPASCSEGKSSCNDEAASTSQPPDIPTSLPGPSCSQQDNATSRHCSPVKTTGTPRALNFGSSPAKDTTAKLTIGEIRAKLKSSDVLKSRLAKFSKLSEQLSSVEAKERQLKLQEFGSIDVEVPLSPRKVAPYSSPVKVPLSPLKSPGKTLGSRLAAWQQHRALAESRAEVLPLPWKYRSLLEHFKAVDVVVSMLVNRKESVTFAKLQPAVEEMTRLNFSQQHLGQINKLFPSAFTFAIEKRKTMALTGRPDVFDLSICPNYQCLDIPGVGEGLVHTGGKLLQTRHQHFRTLLVERVKDFHQEFLSHLEPPLEIPREQLTRWHPGFDAEQIPDVEIATLPQPPNLEKLSTAREVLDCARNILSCNSRVQTALARLSEERGEISQSSSNINMAPVNPALRGVPTSLLDKIRAKQAARALEVMTRTPTQDKLQAKLQHLPELARVLRNVYVSEKKTVMPLDTVLDKLMHSYPHTLTCGEMDELLKLLCTQAPGLVERLHMRQSTFIRVNKNTKMCEVIALLESKIKPLI